MSATNEEKQAIAETFNHDDGEGVAAEKYASCSRLPKRYILAFMAFLGYCNVYALRVNLSVAIVAMTRNYTVTINGTDFTVRDFEWSPQMQGLILSSFFWGYILTQIPGGWLAKRYGGKYLFGVGILGTAVLTIITPPVARLGAPLLVAIRVLEGFMEGTSYPSIVAMWAVWAPPLERTKLFTFAKSGARALGKLLYTFCSTVVDDFFLFHQLPYGLGLAIVKEVLCCGYIFNVVVNYSRVVVEV